MFYLKRNVPGWERLARVMMAAGLGGAALFADVSGSAHVIWGIIAVMALMTGVIGYCPACAMVGRKPVK